MYYSYKYIYVDVKNIVASFLTRWLLKKIFFLNIGLSIETLSTVTNPCKICPKGAIRLLLSFFMSVYPQLQLSWRLIYQILVM